MPVTLIPVNPTDRTLMGIMTRASSPRWMRLAACLAMEGRRLVLVRGGHPVLDPCASCGRVGPATVHAFHKNRLGGDARCVLTCDHCATIEENRPLTDLEAREANPLSGIREAF